MQKNRVGDNSQSCCEESSSVCGGGCEEGSSVLTGFLGLYHDAFQASIKTVVLHIGKKPNLPPLSKAGGVGRQSQAGSLRDSLLWV